MPSIMRLTKLALPLFMAANVHAQGVILSAQGAKGSPASLALQVKTNNTADANFMTAAEVNANIVNECGRTLLAGNIDIGSNTEDQLANKTVTSVTKGSKVAVTIRQGGANGAGPYTCDMDQTSNSLGSGQTNLTTTEKANADGTIALFVTMPATMACIGASPGNICTVRCFNAQAFGGCFAVQQTDTAASKNNANTIATAQTLAGINLQVAENQVDLPAAIAANQESTTGKEQEQGLNGANTLLKLTGLDKGNVADAVGSASVSVSGTGSASATKTGKGKKAKVTASAAGTKKAKGTASASASVMVANAAASATATSSASAKNAEKNQARVFVA